VCLKEIYNIEGRKLKVISLKVLFVACFPENKKKRERGESE
jgi:hypothetical protein